MDTTDVYLKKNIIIISSTKYVPTYILGIGEVHLSKHLLLFTLTSVL